MSDINKIETKNPDPNAPKSKFRNRKNIILIILFAGLIFAASFLTIQYVSNKKAKDDSKIVIPFVDTDQVSKTASEVVGDVDSYKSTDANSGSASYVANQNISNGKFDEAEKLLLKIDENISPQVAITKYIDLITLYTSSKNQTKYSEARSKLKALMSASKDPADISNFKNFDTYYPEQIPEIKPEASNEQSN